MNCERKNKWWRGCRFEPRYDLGPATGVPKMKCHDDPVPILEQFRTKTYVYDVCIRCGKTERREP